MNKINVPQIASELISEGYKNSKTPGGGMPPDPPTSGLVGYAHSTTDFVPPPLKFLDLPLIW